MSQLPFKVEITPQVLVLLCLIGVCLFLGDFCTFLAVLSLTLIFHVLSIEFYQTI